MHVLELDFLRNTWRCVAHGAELEEECPRFIDDELMPGLDTATM